MEYLEHELKDLMKNMRSNFSIPEVKCFLIQLLKGVAHLHNNHIIHRYEIPPQLRETLRVLLQIGRERSSDHLSTKQGLEDVQSLVE